MNVTVNVLEVIERGLTNFSTEKKWASWLTKSIFLIRLFEGAGMVDKAEYYVDKLAIVVKLQKLNQHRAYRWTLMMFSDPDFDSRSATPQLVLDRIIDPLLCEAYAEYLQDIAKVKAKPRATVNML